MGLFISVEGGEGTGKSTQVKLLCERLTAVGHKVVSVREPGGTELGNYLRDYLKSTSKPLTPEAELFLFVASRSEVVRRVIRPALEAGGIVVADRYADSTAAYQGYGRRLPARQVTSANQLATDGLWPDLTLLLDAPPDVTLARARVQTSLEDKRDDRQRMADELSRGKESGQQRFEIAGASFHRRVREGYLKLAAKEPQRWAVLDASLPVDALAGLVWQKVADLLSVRSVAPESGARRFPGV